MSHKMSHKMSQTENQFNATKKNASDRKPKLRRLFVLALTCVALGSTSKSHAQSTGYWSGTSVPTSTTSNVRVSDGDVWIRSVDNSHGIGYYGSSKPYAGLNIDGPVVYGWAGGALGITKANGTSQNAVLRWFDDGKVTIGSVPSRPADYKLFVEGGILTEKIRVAVKTTSDWADYVFSSDYNLMPLSELKDYVAKNKHLPEVPSTSDVMSKGVDLQKMDATLLKKVEELTLYVLAQQNEIAQLKKTLAKKN